MQNHPQKTLDKNLAVWYNGNSGGLQPWRPQTARQIKKCRALGTWRSAYWHSQAPQVVPQLWRPALRSGTRYSVLSRRVSHFVSLTFCIYYSMYLLICQALFLFFFVGLVIQALPCTALRRTDLRHGQGW